jgi:hypothetical protein
MGERNGRGRGISGGCEVDPGVLSSYIPDFAVDFHDISHIPDERIRGEVTVRAMLLLMKHIQSPDLLDAVPAILGLLQKISTAQGAMECIEVFIRYLTTAVPSEKQEELTRKVSKSLKEGGRIMPSIAQKWIHEGIERGIERGIEKGIEQGIEKGIERGIEQGIEKEKLASARRMVQMRIPDEDIRKITGLPIEVIASLRKAKKR